MGHGSLTPVVKKALLLVKKWRLMASLSRFQTCSTSYGVSSTLEGSQVPGNVFMLRVLSVTRIVPAFGSGCRLSEHLS